MAEQLSNQTLLTKASWPMKKKYMVNKNCILKPKQNAAPMVKHWSGTKLVANQATSLLKHIVVNS